MPPGAHGDAQRAEAHAFWCPEERPIQNCAVLCGTTTVSWTSVQVLSVSQELTWLSGNHAAPSSRHRRWPRSQHRLTGNAQALFKRQLSIHVPQSCVTLGNAAHLSGSAFPTYKTLTPESSLSDETSGHFRISAVGLQSAFLPVSCKDLVKITALEFLKVRCVRTKQTEKMKARKASVFLCLENLLKERQTDKQLALESACTAL